MLFSIANWHLYLLYSFGLGVTPGATCPHHSSLRVMDANLLGVSSLEELPLKSNIAMCRAHASNVLVVYQWVLCWIQDGQVIGKKNPVHT